MCYNIAMLSISLGKRGGLPEISLFLSVGIVGHTCRVSSEQQLYFGKLLLP